MNRKKSNIRIAYSNTKWAMIGKLLTQVFGLVALVFVIRKLEVDVFGTFSFILTIFMFFQVFGLSPFTAVIKRYIPELMQHDDYLQVRALLINLCIASIAIFALIAFAFYFYQVEIGAFFKIPTLSNYITVTLVFFFVHFYERITTTALQSLLLNKSLSKVSIVASLTKASLYIVFLKELDVFSLLLIEICYSLIILLWGAVVVIGHLQKNILAYCSEAYSSEGYSRSPLEFKRLRRYALFSFLSEFGQGALGRSSDIFIVAAISNPVQVGMYAFGNRVYSMFHKFIPAKELMSVIRPVFIKKFSSGYENAEFMNMYNFIIKLLLPLYITPALYFLAFGENLIVYIFDVKYSAAYFVTLVLLCSNIFHGIFISQGITIELLERVEIKFYTQAITFVSIFVGIYAMNRWGINGLALVTSSALALKYIIMQYLLRRHIAIEYDMTAYFKYTAIYAVLTAIFIPINDRIDSLGLLLLGSALYGLLLLLLIYLINPFNDFDKDLVNKIAGSSRLFGVLKKLKILS